MDHLKRDMKAHSLMTTPSTSTAPLSLGVSGDLMFDTGMMSAAFSSPTTYRSLLHHEILNLIKSPDLFYANFEGTSAHGLDHNWKEVKDPGMVAGGVYGWLNNSINNHPKLAADLTVAGVDVVSLSNNHCLDRGHVGVKRTIDACKAGGLTHFGTRRDSSTCDGWYTVIRRNGWNVAWVGCTDKIRSKRGHFKDSDKHDQVLFCKSPVFLRLISLLSRQPSIDAVIAAVHWGGREEADDSKDHGHHPHHWRGTCYSTRVTASMRKFAKAIVDAGAATVLGTHPHVLMEWETYESKGRHALIAYSLGNAISRQGAGFGLGHVGGPIYNCHRREKIPAKECRHRLLSHAIMFLNLTRTADGPTVSCFSYIETGFQKKLMMEQVDYSTGKKTHADLVLGSKWRTTPKKLTCFPLATVGQGRRRRRQAGLVAERIF